MYTKKIQKKLTAIKLDRSKRPKLNQVNMTSDIKKISNILGIDYTITCNEVARDTFLINRSPS